MKTEEVTIMTIIIWICCSALTYTQANSDYMIVPVVATILWMMVFVRSNME